jgi:hypothetical protein
MSSTGATGRAAKPKPRTRARLQDGAVLWVRHEAKCAQCRIWIRKDGFLLKTVKKRSLCLACAGLGHLVFLPRGDTALTRRASQHSAVHAIVVKRVRGRLERQGTLVEKEALERAQHECEADAEVRERARAKAAVRRAVVDERYVRQFTERVGELCPGCPVDEREAIAKRACEKYSGRIGRSAAAVRFEPRAIGIAIRAHIRHNHTNYDELLTRGVERKKARSKVRDAVKKKFERWQSNAPG